MDESWICDECTVWNEKDLSACIGCGNPRPPVIGVQPYAAVMPARNYGVVRGAPPVPSHPSQHYHHNQVEEGGRSGFCFPGLVAVALSGALTGVFALAPHCLERTVEENLTILRVRTEEVLATTEYHF